MSSKLVNILDLITPTETGSNTKTIIILVIALVLVLAVATVLVKGINKNEAKVGSSKKTDKTSKKK